MRPTLLAALLLTFACRDALEDNKDDDVIDIPVDTDTDLPSVTDADDDGYDEGDDCDDSNADINPGATEIPYNGIDEDCDPATLDDDLDGDGFGNDEDCDDGNASIRPDATEDCDGIDNDCNGSIDDAVGDVWYADDDGDGFGDPNVEVLSCDGSGALVQDATDCDDTRADVFPGAVEVCDDADQDCNGAPDDAPSDGAIFYEDLDGDSWGDELSTTIACDAPPGFVPTPGDCDDTTAAVSPAGTEICNQIDDDCDGTVDGPGATDADSFYLDLDGDGFGDDQIATTACQAPFGYVEEGGDCDDRAPEALPGGTEVCDGLDNDCDGRIDGADATDVTTFYEDVDGDGFGDSSATLAACGAPAGYVPAEGDCDDTVPTVHPGAAELCDGIDNDCNGSSDETPGLEGTWYADVDGDGFGDASDTQSSCARPDGYVAGPGDCDDDDLTRFPGADELCDGIDNDCDGLDDDNAIDAPTWYADGDSDGFGGALSLTQCSAPAGYVADAGDCRDGNDTVYPGADELCDSLDNDCDGAVDEDPTNPGSWYLDEDGDGAGAGVEVLACAAPPDHAGNDDDCDDDDPAIRPGAVEVCNDVDDDCNGAVDDDANNPRAYYADGDGDGWGTDTVQLACTAPPGYADRAGDCDDNASAINPAEDEVCDGLDNDCSGTADGPGATDAETAWLDNDGDGYGSAGTVYVGCDVPTDYVNDHTDCLDTNPAVFPGAEEVCDGLDNDCNATVDDGASGASTWYADLDGDGYGDADDATDSCNQPPDTVSHAGDCDDEDSEVRPNALETCNNTDDDCNGQIDDDAIDVSTGYADGDGDGFGAGDAIVACTLPPGAVGNSRDCDDAAAGVNPAATEVCNEIDDDCSGAVDDDAVDATTWYLDGDNDGYAGTTTTLACAPPPDHLGASTDCDDADNDIHPDAAEICNDIDDDCNGQIDDDPTDPTAFYSDADGDGFGTGAATFACDAPVATAPGDGDCDDDDDTIFPGADEVCNAVDDDCDDRIDEGDAIDATTWYLDADGDGYGTPDVTLDACTAPPSFLDDDQDCDDLRAQAFPGADETCNELDDDCDDEVDEDPVDGISYFLDDDRDGSGDSGTEVIACEPPGEDWTTLDGDCDDSDARVEEGIEERCNGVDDDCDGTVDEDCYDVIEIGPPSHPSPGDIEAPGACAQLSEVNNTMNPHDISNLDSFMEYLEGTRTGLVAQTITTSEIMDWSIRCGSDLLASRGNYSPTTPWPAMMPLGNHGANRYRGYIHIPEGGDLNRTLGLIGNDALRLTIEGDVIIEQWWLSGQWKKFRHVSFPAPGLYTFQIEWSTNFVCGIDPMEFIWSEELIDGFGDYDTMCASSSCGAYGDGVSIESLLPLEGDELTRRADGTDGSCTPCNLTTDCGLDEICGAAGVCE